MDQEGKQNEECKARQINGLNHPVQADVFSKDLLFIPINYAYHWTLGVVDIRNKLIQVYDSLGGDHKYTLEVVFTVLML